MFLLALFFCFFASAFSVAGSVGPKESVSDTYTRLNTVPDGSYRSMTWCVTVMAYYFCFASSAAQLHSY